MENQTSLLNELWKGFYSLDGMPKLTNENLVVAVHPFYRKQCYFDDEDIYLQKLNEFIATRNSPIITLEEKTRTENTARHYFFLNSRDNRFFIKTGIDNSYPIEISMENFINYVKSLRNKNPIDLIGGYLYKNPDFLPDFGGCLGYIWEILLREKIPVRFLDDLIFDAD